MRQPLYDNSHLRNAVYGTSYLALRCMAETYGDDRMLRFVDLVVRRGEYLEAAAETAFDTVWDTIDGSGGLCFEYVRDAAQ